MKTKKIVLAVGVLALLVMAGCGPSEAAPRLATTPEDITGTWERQADPGEHWRFIRMDDGMLLFGESLDALDNGTEGTDLRMSEFWFEGTQFHIRETTVALCMSDVGIYEVELLANGHLLFKPVEDNCASRTTYLQGTRTSLDEDPVVEWAPVR